MVFQRLVIHFPKHHVCKHTPLKSDLEPKNKVWKMIFPFKGFISGSMLIFGGVLGIQIPGTVHRQSEPPMNHWLASSSWLTNTQRKSYASRLEGSDLSSFGLVSVEEGGLGIQSAFIGSAYYLNMYINIYIYMHNMHVYIPGKYDLGLVLAYYPFWTCGHFRKIPQLKKHLDFKVRMGRVPVHLTWKYST